MLGNFELPILTALYVDFEKAFDKVSHEKILEKLQNDGVARGVLDLLKTYLKDHKQGKSGNSIS